MPSTVTSLKVTYEEKGDTNIFRNGDNVCGNVTLELSKECKVQYLYVKFKGKAEVLWTERHGQTTVTYHSKDKYFSVRNYFLGSDDTAGANDQSMLKNHDGETSSNVLSAGIHVYPFSFQFPMQEMPSSFKGSVGKVVYLLEAKLSRSMRISTTDTIKIPFATQAASNNVPGLMTPQHESKDKKMKLFNSGTVAMDVSLEKTGFFQGEGIKVLAIIQNNSSREIKPKYCIYSKHSFFARGKRRLHTKDLFKEVGQPIAPSTNQTVTRIITIPHDVEPSIYNCTILKAEYRLRVYLDVKYASDPEIKFPIVILPAPEGSAMAPTMYATPAGFEYGAFGDQNPPVWSTVPPSLLSDPPPSYDGLYPTFTDFGAKYQ
ncbi:arrestin domain-containing protein 2-like [Nerophis ophidion]|uniref:arrestin domain-containing protein 2-like n=1 Tax=Nerophis ophidion TaxID=159077 RepID=UPI002AE044C9|nr:arrestin domain-containing protein 2-like [Nerophis ophidion]